MIKAIEIEENEVLITVEQCSGKFCLSGERSYRVRCSQCSTWGKEMISFIGVDTNGYHPLWTCDDCLVKRGEFSEEDIAMIRTFLSLNSKNIYKYGVLYFKTDSLKRGGEWDEKQSNSWFINKRDG